MNKEGALGAKVIQHFDRHITSNQEMADKQDADGK